MAVFTITATVMRIPIGLLIDRVGRKPFLLYGIAFFIAGKLGYLWAPSILLMLPFRVLHGLGWSGCTTAVSTINADIVPQARRGELMGYAGMASSLASALEASRAPTMCSRVSVSPGSRPDRSTMNNGQRYAISPASAAGAMPKS